MYSLVNVPTLVRDLGRHPRGDAVAHELLRVLSLEPTDLAELDRTSYDGTTARAVRDELVGTDRATPAALQVLRATRDVAEEVGMSAWVAAVDVLEQTPIADLNALVRFVRDDAVADAWSRDRDIALARWPVALDVATDGVVAAYCGDSRLGVHWQEWWRGRAVGMPAWPDVVEAVAAVPADADWPHPPSNWATLVHDACWAVHLTGRGHAAAVTQLHALRALLSRGSRPPLRAVATVVAAVHAHAVDDVLDADTHLRMTAPLFRLLP